MFGEEERRANIWVGSKHFSPGPTKNLPLWNRDKTSVKTPIEYERQMCPHLFALTYLWLISTFPQSSHQSSASSQFNCNKVSTSLSLSLSLSFPPPCHHYLFSYLLCFLFSFAVENQVWPPFFFFPYPCCHSFFQLLIFFPFFFKDFLFFFLLYLNFVLFLFLIKNADRRPRIKLHIIYSFSLCLFYPIFACSDHLCFFISNLFIFFHTWPFAILLFSFYFYFLQTSLGFIESKHIKKLCFVWKRPCGLFEVHVL